MIDQLHPRFSKFSRYPLVMTNIAIENGHLVSFRMKKLWIYSSVNVYQAGKFPIISPINPYKSPWYPYKSL